LVDIGYAFGDKVLIKKICPSNFDTYNTFKHAHNEENQCKQSTEQSNQSIERPIEQSNQLNQFKQIIVCSNECHAIAIKKKQ
jgi:hypothetical protein